MKLHELLKVLGPSESVGIWNIDDDRHKCPTRQQYAKINNLPYGKLRNILNYDVFAINTVNNGLLIRVYRKDRLEQSLSHHDIAQKIKQALT